MDTLAAMRTFVAIVDAGSLTAAAEMLDRSQPTVVRTLAALEAHLGARLLQRTTRRMSLTAEGTAYLGRCQQILADVDEAERAVNQDPEHLRGRLRITAPVQFGQRHVAPLVTTWLESHPELAADLILLDRNVDLLEEGLDLAIRIGPLPDSGLVGLPAGEMSRVVVASPGLLKRTGEPTHPTQLGALPCLRIQALARSRRWIFWEKGREISVQVSGRFGSNQIASSVEACIDGLGFGQFLSYQVCEALGAGQLVRVLQPFETLNIPVSVVYPGGRLISARQRTTARFLQQELKKRTAAIGRSFAA